ncbi:MAG: hypothetical protein HY906_14820 [Deltaproteobacteria bacterium]|nr:hypothetical protein [Deltaproteobacteria bacterium]
MRLAFALAASLVALAMAGCRWRCDSVPARGGGSRGWGFPSNVEHVFGFGVVDPTQSCDETSPELREVKMELFDEAGAFIPPTRVDYVNQCEYPHTTTRMLGSGYFATVPRGGDYFFRATFPEDKGPPDEYVTMVPQYRGDESRAALPPAQGNTVGNLGPDLWLCDGLVFRGTERLWEVPETGLAISRAVEGVAWVHAGNTVYRFEGGRVRQSAQAEDGWAGSPTTT